MLRAHSDFIAVGSLAFADTLALMSELAKVTSDRLSKPALLQRLGRNINGYFGESIDIDAVLSDCIAAAHAHRWTVEEIANNSGFTLVAFMRSAQLNPQALA